MRFEGACSVLRSCVGALIVAKYLAEQKPGGLGKAIGEDELEEDVSSSNSSSAGGSKPLPPLKEPVTGIFIPATLEVEGGAGPLVSVGCGPRIKKLGFIEVKVYALGVFVEASATSQAALEPLQGADVFKALLSQVCFDLGGWSNFDVVSRFRPQSPRRSCIACLCPPPPPLTCAFRGASRRGGAWVCSARLAGPRHFFPAGATPGVCAKRDGEAGGRRARGKAQGRPLARSLQRLQPSPLGRYTHRATARRRRPHAALAPFRLATYTPAPTRSTCPVQALVHAGFVCGRVHLLSSVWVC